MKRQSKNRITLYLQSDSQFFGKSEFLAFTLPVIVPIPYPTVLVLRTSQMAYEKYVLVDSAAVADSDNTDYYNVVVTMWYSCDCYALVVRGMTSSALLQFDVAATMPAD